MLILKNHDIFEKYINENEGKIIKIEIQYA